MLCRRGYSSAKQGSFVNKTKEESLRLLTMTKKNRLKRLHTPVLYVAIILFIVSLFPFNAFAKANTLGSENPNIYCEFTDSQGNRADGDELAPGTYTVDIMLSGMNTVSIFDVSAEFDPQVITNLDIVSTIADSTDEFSCGCQRVDTDEINRILIILSTENDDCTSINSRGTSMATLTVTIASTCDFKNVFVFNESVDVSFVAADLGDGFEKRYVSVNTAGESEKWYKKLHFDASPLLSESSFDVEGKIMIATNLDGTNSSVGIGGITVSVDGTDISAVTESDGSYVLSSVPVGDDYTLTISGTTTVDRKVTLSVSSDRAENGVITVADIPVCVCDYNRDGKINAADNITYFASYGAEYYGAEYNVYCDFNGDGKVNASDNVVYFAFYGQTVNYVNVTL